MEEAAVESTKGALKAVSSKTLDKKDKKNVGKEFQKLQSIKSETKMKSKQMFFFEGSRLNWLD